MEILFNICLLLSFVKVSFSTTSIKTYPTVNLRENCPINSHVITLGGKEMKLILLNLGGFETNLFVIINSSIYTINEIDREQFLGEKRCFDRSFCLIEIHILVNDGQQYWVVPIHIIDENDNKPEFKSSSISLKFRENIPGGYKIPFEGAKDIDEGLNGKIRYILDCSGMKRSRILSNVSSIECFPLFELLILSQSTLLNQNDQLALKFVPSEEEEDLKSSYELILYAIDNAENGKELENSMKIEIEIEKELRKPKFSLSVYEFVIRIDSLLKKDQIIGKVEAQSNDKNQIISYKILNKSERNLIEINSLTGELFILNENDFNLINEITLLIESFYLFKKENNSLKSLTKVHFYFRSKERVNEISLNYNLQSLLIEQINSEIFYLNENISSNEILFKLSIESLFYPEDKYLVFLQNSYSTFSFLSSSSSNDFILKTRHSLKRKFIYLLTIQIKHQLTQQWLPNRTIQLIVVDQTTTTISSNLLKSSTICQENSTFLLYDLNNKSSLGKLKIIESNSNIFSFSNFLISINQSEFIINDCRMRFIDQLDQSHPNSSQYQLCSLENNLCYNITHINNQQTFSKFSFSLRPIEITILALSIVFILATITLIFIICRLKGIHLCLKIKNYLFYGKKYGLSNAQRLSADKMTQRIHSIVVRESQSPSIKPKEYLFNKDSFIGQETVSPNVSSSLQRKEERTRSNLENEITNRTLSSPYVQETKQLLEMISSNQDLNVSRLASEV